MAEIRLSAYPHPLPPLISIFPLRHQLPFFCHYYFFLRITGPFISLIFECACQNVYQIFSIREYFHFLFSVMLCSKTHFPPHLLSISNKTEQKETVQSSWTLDIWTNTCFIGKQTRNSLWSDFQFVLKCALQCNKWVAFLVSIINPPPPKKIPLTYLNRICNCSC